MNSVVVLAPQDKT